MYKKRFSRLGTQCPCLSSSIFTTVSFLRLSHLLKLLSGAVRHTKTILFFWQCLFSKLQKHFLFAVECYTLYMHTAQFTSSFYLPTPFSLSSVLRQLIHAAIMLQHSGLGSRYTQLSSEYKQSFPNNS